MADDPKRRQLRLFADDEVKPAPGVEPVAPDPELRELASRLPDQLRLGTSSWSFPGWKGLVYRKKVSAKRLSKEGLSAYASHPLFRTVGLDRTHYAPMSAEEFRAHADQVPDDFRFLVKAHEACTLLRFPQHPRYGRLKGKENDRFLDPEYALREVVQPVLSGLGEKAGPILFQVAPQSFEPIGGNGAFIERLHEFLGSLPQGPLYAVEIRNRELLRESYAAALKDRDAVHCLNALERMPSLDEQWHLARVGQARAMVIRWMVHPTLDYDQAKQRYEPFDRLVDEDPRTRATISELVLGAAEAGQPIYVIVNNKAEGSSPLSILELARTIAADTNDHST
ncbi:MAG: DUF72 domain-containing protein [Planctomycetota bacterium]